MITLRIVHVRRHASSQPCAWCEHLQCLKPLILSLLSSIVPTCFAFPHPFDLSQHEDESDDDVDAGDDELLDEALLKGGEAAQRALYAITFGPFLLHPYAFSSQLRPRELWKVQL